MDAAHSEAARALAELRASEARLRSLFETTTQGIAIMKLVRDEAGAVVDARYLEVNSAFGRLTKLDRASVVGRRSSEVFPLNFASWQPRLATVTGTDGPEHFESFIPDIGRWFSFHAAPFGEPDAFVVFFDDVSDRKRRELQQAFLLKLSDALRPLTDAAEIQQTAARVLGEHLQVTRAMYADVEGDPGAEVGILRGQYHRSQEPESGLVLPSFPERYGYDGYGERVMALRRRGETMVVADVATDERFEAGERAAWVAGGVRAAVTVALVKGGRFVADLGVQSAAPRDWTPDEVALVEETAERTWAAVERARAEAALRESETRTRFQAELLASSAEAMAATDEHVVITYWNRAAEELFGWTAEEAIGRRARDVLRGTVSNPTRETVIAALLDRGSFQGEAGYHRKDGSVVMTEIHSAALRDVGGEFRGTVTAFRDVTVRKRAEEALQESEARQAFLLELSDAVRACPDEHAIKQLTVTMLGDHLQLDRCYVSEVFEDEDYSTVGPEHVRPGHPSMVGRYRLSDYPETQRQMATQPLVIDDADNDPRFSDEQKAMLALVPQRALLVAPLRMGPRKIVWALAGAMATPRRWTDSERVLFEEVAERTWAAVERARAEAALRATEERYRTLFETMGQGYCDLELVRDADGRAVDQRYLQLNPAFERIFGIPASWAQGRTANEVFPGVDPGWHETYDRIARSGTPARFEREEPSLGRWYEVQVFPRGGDRLTVLYQDITDRKLAEAAGREAQSTALEQAERLTMQRTAERDVARWQLLEAEEVERRRLARELHDEAGQHLTAIGLGLQTLSDMAPPGSEVDRRATQLRALVATMSRELHAIAVRLRPKSLDDFGLEAALGAYVQEWTRQTGIEVGVHARTGAERLPGAIESAVYRVVQEALTNVARHSGATHASLIVERRAGQIVAIVEDDGRGFDPDALERVPHEGSGLGLRGMRERAALLGGKADVESTPGGGTTVFVRIPIETRLP